MADEGAESHSEDAPRVFWGREVRASFASKIQYTSWVRITTTVELP